MPSNKYNPRIHQSLLWQQQLELKTKPTLVNFKTFKEDMLAYDCMIQETQSSLKKEGRIFQKWRHSIV